jgi:alkaline phosphatase
MYHTAVYAKAASRYWETDIDTPTDCRDIAHQLVYGEIGRNLNVILGGGYREFLSQSASINFPGRKGRRGDGRNLVMEWAIHNKNHAIIPDRVSVSVKNSFVSNNHVIFII